MFFTLVVAIISTFLWINQWLADFVNARVNPYASTEEDKDRDRFNAKLKLWLIVIMALSWSIVIRFI